MQPMLRKPGSLRCYLPHAFFFFFNFWLHWVMIAVCRLSLVVMSAGYSLLQCMGFSFIVVASLVKEDGL